MPLNPFSRRYFLAGSAAMLAANAVSHAWATPASSEGISMDVPHDIIIQSDRLTQQQITAWLQALRGHPFVEQSGFDVTAVFKVEANGKTYYTAGVNVENHELIVGTCAEEGAIAAAVTALGQKANILEGWVMGAPRGVEHSDLEVYPCGECRQRIAQYTSPDAPIHIVTLSGNIANTQTRAQLLPHAFSFRDLEHNDNTQTENNVAPDYNNEIAPRLFRAPREALSSAEILTWLKDLQGDVRVSHYSEAVIAELENGAYVAGTKVENAAYPSSTTAMQSAMAIMCGQYGAQKILNIWGLRSMTESHAAEVHAAVDYLPGGQELQIMRQFAKDEGLVIHRFNEAGDADLVTLSDLLKRSPTF